VHVGNPKHNSKEMGAYLSTPITHKEEFDGAGESLVFGGSAMQ